MTPQSTSSSPIWIKKKASSKLASNWVNSRAACRQTPQGLRSDRGASRESAVQIFDPSKVFGDGAVQGVALTADGDAVRAVLNIHASMDGSTWIVRHHHRGPDVKMLVRGMRVARDRPGRVDQPSQQIRVDSHPFPGGRPNQVGWRFGHAVGDSLEMRKLDNFAEISGKRDSRTVKARWSRSSIRFSRARR